MNNGWIKLHRQIQDHEFWLGERFTRGQAWIDLILSATHDNKTYFVRGIEVELQVGQVGTSIVLLAKRWSWNERTVARYLEMLVKRGMCTVHKNDIGTVITIQKWKEYQMDTLLSTDQSTEATTDRVQTKVQTIKNEKNGKNEKKINYRPETFTFFEWLDGRCKDLYIENKTQVKTLNIFVERYLGKIQFRPQMDLYLAWMVDNNKRVLHSMAVGNCFKRQFDYNKKQELKKFDVQQSKKDPYLADQLKRNAQKKPQIEIPADDLHESVDRNPDLEFSSLSND